MSHTKIIISNSRQVRKKALYSQGRKRKILPNATFPARFASLLLNHIHKVMKTLNTLLALTFILFSFTTCNDDEPLPEVCPEPSKVISVLTVDYTTNEFLGGYYINLPDEALSDSFVFEPESEYNIPSDFGDITWYDKTTRTKLFAGTIVWCGKGAMTYPKETNPVSAYSKTSDLAHLPTFTRLLNDEYSVDDPDFDYSPVWAAVSNLQEIEYSQIVSPSAPVYIYLYRPSVGAGDPEDWYWLIISRLN